MPPDMGYPVKGIAAVFVLVVLMVLPPVLSEGAIDHGRRVIRLPQRASRSAILPDAESRLLVLVNRARQTHGLSPLIVDPSLRAVARQHSRDMALQGYVGHGSSDGRALRDRLARFTHLGVRVYENVAVVQSIEQGHGAFVASPAHLRNMLDPAIRRVGIGVATAGEAGIMITEDFV